MTQKRAKCTAEIIDFVTIFAYVLLKKDERSKYPGFSNNNAVDDQVTYTNQLQGMLDSFICVLV